jgi:hypothetical protein
MCTLLAPELIDGFFPHVRYSRATQCIVPENRTLQLWVATADPKYFDLFILEGFVS